MAEGFEDVVREPLSLLERRAAVDRIEDESARVGGTPVLQEVGAVAKITNRRPLRLTDHADDSTHPVRPPAGNYTTPLPQPLSIEL